MKAFIIELDGNPEACMKLVGIVEWVSKCFEEVSRTFEEWFDCFGFVCTKSWDYFSNLDCRFESKGHLFAAPLPLVPW